MSNSFITRIKTNLNGVLQMTKVFDGIMMTGDDQANQIIVELHRDRVPYLIPAGTRIVGYFIRSDGVTLEVDGEVIDTGADEGKARVVVPALAYAVPGVLSIAVRMFIGGQQVEQRGYYERIESGDFVVVDDSITVGPNGEPVITRVVTEDRTVRAYTDSETGVLVIVIDPDTKEGPHGEVISEMTIAESRTERGYYKIDVGEFIIVDDPSITEGPHGEPIITRTTTVYSDKTVIAAASCFVQMTETESIIEPGHLIPDLNDIINKLAEIDEKIQYINAEDAVWNENEAARTSAETARLSAESIRANAEAARKSAETGRVNAESGRVNAETDRVNAEAARKSAETGRVNVETSRVNAEIGRVNAESARVNAENARVQAEQRRATAENTRVSQETARQNAIQNMSIDAEALPFSDSPTATITDVNGHKHIHLGLTSGRPFRIKRSFTSVAEMQRYVGTDVELYDFVVIESNVQDPDNAKLYMKVSDGWFYVTDLSGAQGIQGPQGPQGIQGVSISSVALNSNYTLTINYSNGTSTTTSSIRGEVGPRGISITGITSNSDYTLTISLSDGTLYRTGSLRGEKGEKGDKGDKGDKGEPGAGGIDYDYDDTTQALILTFG